MEHWQDWGQQAEGVGVKWLRSGSTLACMLCQAMVVTDGEANQGVQVRGRLDGDQLILNTFSEPNIECLVESLVIPPTIRSQGPELKRHFLAPLFEYVDPAGDIMWGEEQIVATMGNR